MILRVIDVLIQNLINAVTSNDVDIRQSITRFISDDIVAS